MLPHRLFQKLKLIGNDKFNHLINTLTLFSHVDSNSPSTNETQHMKYLTEIRSE
jgi:hypothetical protein